MSLSLGLLAYVLRSVTWYALVFLSTRSSYLSSSFVYFSLTFTLPILFRSLIRIRGHTTGRRLPMPFHALVRQASATEARGFHVKTRDCALLLAVAKEDSCVHRGGHMLS